MGNANRRHKGGRPFMNDMKNVPPQFGIYEIGRHLLTIKNRLMYEGNSEAISIQSSAIRSIIFNASNINFITDVSGFDIDPEEGCIGMAWERFLLFLKKEISNPKIGESIDYIDILKDIFINLVFKKITKLNIVLGTNYAKIQQLQNSENLKIYFSKFIYTELKKLENSKSSKQASEIFEGILSQIDSDYEEIKKIEKQKVLLVSITKEELLGLIDPNIDSALESYPILNISEICKEYDRVKYNQTVPDDIRDRSSHFKKSKEYLDKFELFKHAYRELGKLYKQAYDNLINLLISKMVNKFMITIFMEEILGIILKDINKQILYKWGVIEHFHNCYCICRDCQHMINHSLDTTITCERFIYQYIIKTFIDYIGNITIDTIFKNFLIIKEDIIEQYDIIMRNNHCDKYGYFTYNNNNEPITIIYN